MLPPPAIIFWTLAFRIQIKLDSDMLRAGLCLVDKQHEYQKDLQGSCAISNLFLCNSIKSPHLSKKKQNKKHKNKFVFFGRGLSSSPFASSDVFCVSQLNSLHSELANQMADSMVFPLIQFREKDLTGNGLIE